MKNQITLSLITAAILGLNGCGGSSRSAEASDNGIKSSSIQKLSKASTKHTESDWIELENNIQALDNTEGFNTMLLDSIEKNVATLTYVGVDKEMAYATNSDAMFEDLTDLDIEDLDSQVLAECKEADETCKEMAYDSLRASVLIDKEMAYAIATDIRKDEEKPSTMDGLLKEFTCETGLVRKVQFYGVEDNFSTTNGDENASASQQVRANPSMIAYNTNVGADFANYDGQKQNRLFAEEVKNLPTSIANGHFYIGMNNQGGNDGITLGNLDENSSTNDYYSEPIHNNPDLTKTGQVYHAPLANINLRDNTTSLKNYAYNNQGFDVYVQDDTFVDFIAVATCSKPNPIKDVTTIIDKFECSEKETMVKIFGGELDIFNPTTDTNPINPRANLISLRDGNTVYPGVDVDYDYTAYDYHFIDTLQNFPTGTISKAQFSMGYKALGTPLVGNDVMYLGEMGKNHMGLQVYNTTMSQSINNEYLLLTSDLMTANTVGTGTVFDTMVNNGFLDIYVQDDTAVDFTQLNLCVKDNCDEGAEDISLDLSQLASWTTSATDAVNNSNPLPNVWDSSLNWIEFTSKEANGDRVLEIPFCACSNALIDIKSLKVDNLATVKLDNNTTIVTQNASGQASMRADNNGGVHASGSHTTTNTSGPTNHVLRVDVHNQGLWFGVGIEGTLNFKGNLGECK